MFNMIGELLQIGSKRSQLHAPSIQVHQSTSVRQSINHGHNMFVSTSARSCWESVDQTFGFKFPNRLIEQSVVLGIIPSSEIYHRHVFSMGPSSSEAFLLEQLVHYEALDMGQCPFPTWHELVLGFVSNLLGKKGKTLLAATMPSCQSHNVTLPKRE